MFKKSIFSNKKKAMDMKKLPLGISTFSKVIRNDYLYIDKTDIALDLIENHQYAFLSRPRRFGKSLFIDTLQNIFEGNKELFKDLYIYDKYDFVNYPVIKIAFGGVRSQDDLIKTILNILKFNQKNLGVVCGNKGDYSLWFANLIRESYEKHQKPVVILIDEYDKPILDNLDQMEVAREVRETLKRLYTEIKMNDSYLKFVFLTGVSKFSKASLFSGLNNLSDISLMKRYGNICGYTQNDIETTFLPYLKTVDLEKLKEWYNGYNFLKDKLYNPYDILNFIQNERQYKNYWFETGTPTFLIKLIEKENYFIPKLKNIVLGEELANSFDMEKIRLETVLFQTGYLTIDQIKESQIGDIRYHLRIPNKEVMLSLNNAIINYLTDNTPRVLYQDDIYLSLRHRHMENLENALRSLFSAIPYSNFTKNKIYEYEGYYASVVYAYLASLGLELIAEDVTNRGRIDLTVKIDAYIYIIEFKVFDEAPLRQIKEKKYYEKYTGLNKEVVLVGIAFNKSIKNIEKFEWEVVK
jgi:hypothetical protein